MNKVMKKVWFAIIKPLSFVAVALEIMIGALYLIVDLSFGHLPGSIVRHALVIIGGVVVVLVLNRSQKRPPSFLDKDYKKLSFPFVLLAALLLFAEIMDVISGFSVPVILAILARIAVIVLFMVAIRTNDNSKAKTLLLIAFAAFAVLHLILFFADAGRFISLLFAIFTISLDQVLLVTNLMFINLFSVGQSVLIIASSIIGFIALLKTTNFSSQSTESVSTLATKSGSNSKSTRDQYDSGLDYDDPSLWAD